MRRISVRMPASNWTGRSRATPPTCRGVLNDTVRCLAGTTADPCGARPHRTGRAARAAAANWLSSASDGRSARDTMPPRPGCARTCPTRSPPSPAPRAAAPPGWRPSPRSSASTATEHAGVAVNASSRVVLLGLGAGADVVGPDRPVARRPTRHFFGRTSRRRRDGRAGGDCILVVEPSHEDQPLVRSSPARPATSRARRGGWPPASGPRGSSRSVDHSHPPPPPEGQFELGKIIRRCTNFSEALHPALSNSASRKPSPHAREQSVWSLQWSTSACSV